MKGHDLSGAEGRKHIEEIINKRK